MSCCTEICLTKKLTIFFFLLRIDDILADSDSDMSDGEDNKENPKTKSKNSETYIRETEDSIVDFADPDAFSKITSKFITTFNIFSVNSNNYFLPSIKATIKQN